MLESFKTALNIYGYITKLHKQHAEVKPKHAKRIYATLDKAKPNTGSKTHLANLGSGQTIVQATDLSL